MGDSQSEEAIEAFLEWQEAHGTWFHPHLEFQQDSVTGLSLMASQQIDADTTIVKLPAKLALTPSRCRAKFQTLFKVGKSSLPSFDMPGTWMAFYLYVMSQFDDNVAEKHVSSPDESSRSAKRSRLSPSSTLDDFASHLPYVKLLPKEIPLPPSYTESEMELLKGTPLHGDALERLQKFWISFCRAHRYLKQQLYRDTQEGSSKRSPPYRQQLEWIVSGLPILQESDGPPSPQTDPAVKRSFSRWIWAQGAYSSRAFPPYLLAAEEDHMMSGPIMLPGYDFLNHRRGAPVTWTGPRNNGKLGGRTGFESSIDEDALVLLTLRYTVPAGEQAFNCYGPKSNEEFLAGYGFVLPEGLDDTLTLVIGRADCGTSQKLDSSAAADGHNGNSGVEPLPSASALSLRKPWGSRHYWRIQGEGAAEPSSGAPAGLLIELRERLVGEESPESPPALHDSYLLRGYLATPSTSDPNTSDEEGTNHLFADAQSPNGTSDERPRVASMTKRRARRQLEALQLDGEVLETLEELLCCKRKAFRAVQKEIDASDSEVVQSASDDTADAGGKRVVRPHVRYMITIYRRGQAKILDQAIAWTRAKMDELVDLIEGLEDSGHAR